MEARSGKSFQMQILLDTFGLYSPHCRPVCCHWKSRSWQVYVWASTACNQNFGIILVDLRFESVKILVVSKVNIKRVDVCAVITWRKRNCEQTNWSSDFKIYVFNNYIFCVVFIPKGRELKKTKNYPKCRRNNNLHPSSKLLERLFVFPCRLLGLLFRLSDAVKRF